ncbi:hypothetical protein AN958_05231 [Leucoagaricus sp. SymC.cos]|nr:hypothetical protein AN958_05231 [Leucoagaricus sp. SymC.cos]
MGRRTQRLTAVRKKTRRAAEPEENVELDEDELTVPDEASWRTMTPYGLFAISDKDGTKYRFKRGDIATILPQQKTPGETIATHEYWVGKILEIRADAGSEDSHIIWTKVRWFYNAEDALGVVKSLDTSRIGKFERLLSPHWDFVLPHTFNEVISMPILHSYPFVKRKKSRANKKLASKLRGGDSESISAATTSTATGIGGGGGLGEEEDQVGLEDQVPIGPEMFYWRYTIDIINQKINPKPGTKLCICSQPYSPDTTSLLDGVMFFCPRLTCQTSFHVGCLKSAKSIYVSDDDEVIVPTPVPPKGRGSGRGRGTTNTKGKQKAVDVQEQTKANKEVDIQWLTPRAIRRITCTPDSPEPVDLISLLHPPPTSASPTKSYKQQQSKSSPPPMISLLQRVYARQLQHHIHQQRQRQRESSRKHVTSTASNKFKHTSAHSAPSVISTISGGSWIEVEDLLAVDEDNNNGGGDTGEEDQKGVTEQSISTFASKHKSRSTKKAEVNTHPPPPLLNSLLPPPHPVHKFLPLPVKPLTPTTLLATLFLLPSPFPPSYASIASSSTPQPQPQASTSASTSNNLNNPSTSTAPVASTSTLTNPPNTQQDDISSFNSSIDAKDLLLLASQPLVRGAGYIPYLGPTGNVNVVLGARNLVWDVLSAVGGLDLSVSSSSTLSLVEEKEKEAFLARVAEEDETDLNSTQRRQDTQDAEDWRKVTECVSSILSGWKKRFLEGGKMLPPGGEIEDGVVIREGLVVDDKELLFNLNSLLRVDDDTKAKGRNGDGDGDVEMVDATVHDEEEERVEEEVGLGLAYATPTLLLLLSSLYAAFLSLHLLALPTLLPRMTKPDSVDHSPPGLPFEILDEIFSQVEISPNSHTRREGRVMLKSFSLVCQQWRDVAQRRLFIYVFLRPERTASQDFIHSVVHGDERFTGCVKTMRVATGLMGKRFCEKDFAIFVEKLVRLEEIQVAWVDGKHWEDLPPHEAEAYLRLFWKPTLKTVTAAHIAGFFHFPITLFFGGNVDTLNLERSRISSRLRPVALRGMEAQREKLHSTCPELYKRSSLRLKHIKLGWKEDIPLLLRLDRQVAGGFSLESLETFTLQRFLYDDASDRIERFFEAASNLRHFEIYPNVLRRIASKLSNFRSSEQDREEASWASMTRSESHLSLKTLHAHRNPTSDGVVEWIIPYLRKCSYNNDITSIDIADSWFYKIHDKILDGDTEPYFLSQGWEKVDEIISLRFHRLTRVHFALEVDESCWDGKREEFLKWLEFPRLFRRARAEGILSMERRII